MNPLPATLESLIQWTAQKANTLGYQLYRVGVPGLDDYGEMHTPYGTVRIAREPYVITFSIDKMSTRTDQSTQTGPAGR